MPTSGSSLPDKFTVSVNLANPVKRNTAMPPGLVHELERVLTRFGKRDILQRDAVDDAFAPVPEADLKSSLAKGLVPPDAIEQFVDRCHGDAGFWFTTIS